MQAKILFLSSVIGALGAITCIQAVPIEVVYTGDTCECSKKLNYELDIPMPQTAHPHIPSKHGYRIECPSKAKAKVTYSFDFDVEQPIPIIPIPEPKMDLYARVDLMTAAKKDCHAAQELPSSCGHKRYDSRSRYVLPESSAARKIRNLRHPNSLDNTDSELSSQLPPATKILAIFFKSSEQPTFNISKTRNKRDISQIFLRQRKNQKRSDRVVKQYNKRLKDIAVHEERTQSDPRSAALDTKPNGLHPLQKLGSFFKLPRLRNKRDIKGEYDLIEKEREQMDLTIPEIIQYMPETLNPNFKRNKCNFGQSCGHAQLTDTTAKTTTTATTTKNMSAETMAIEQVTTPMVLYEKEVNDFNNEVREETQRYNVEDSSSLYRKRIARNNFTRVCPVIMDVYSPTSKTSYNYGPLADIELLPLYYKYGQIHASQEYTGDLYKHYAPETVHNESKLGAGYEIPSAPEYSNEQLDEIIAAIIRKHSDFLEISTQLDESLVEPVERQKEQTLHFLKSLLTDWGDSKWLRGEDSTIQ